MRGIFGGLSLVGLLISVAILAYVWATHTAVVAKTAKDINGPVNQIAGRGEDGRDAMESITLSPGNVGGHLRSLVVDSIVAGGAMDKVYGLKPKDQILEMGDYAVETNDDFGTATAILLEKYRAGVPLKVRRAGQEIMLAPEHSVADQLNALKSRSGGQ